jgi:hypothetical protein
MPFSKGQFIFAIVFFVAFVLLLIIAYRKDINIHKKYYKGGIWVIVSIIAAIILFYNLARLLR